MQSSAGKSVINSFVKTFIKKKYTFPFSGLWDISIIDTREDLSFNIRLFYIFIYYYPI